MISHFAFKCDRNIIAIVMNDTYLRFILIQEVVLGLVFQIEMKGPFTRLTDIRSPFCRRPEL